MKRVVCFHSDVDFGVTTHLGHRVVQEADADVQVLAHGDRRRAGGAHAEQPARGVCHRRHVALGGGAIAIVRNTDDGIAKTRMTE